jgi:NADH-quinone oxidoreductase subunit G
MKEVGPWDGARSPFTPRPAGDAATAAEGEMILSTWRLLVDDSRGNDGEPYLMATARQPIAVLSPRDFARIAADDGKVTVSTDAGSVTLPAVEGDIADGVVWLPANSSGVSLRRDLRAQAGSIVRIQGGAA